MTQLYADYAVFRDANRHTCIRVGESKRGIQIIPMSVTELKIETISRHDFERDYELLSDYTPQRAAERYLFTGDGVHPQVSLEARQHLERLAGPAYKRETLDDIPAPKPIVHSQESTTMATAKKTAKSAPAKQKKATAAKEAPAKKAATKKTEGTGQRGRAPNIADTAKIKILVKENPKRGTAAERFALYKNGMTVAEYIAAGGKRADVNWDVGQQFIEVK